jgi:DNA-binding transcriptional LysR family regulator
MLSLPRLNTLREVARRESISAAAAALDYTQSAVSQQVAALEREAKTALLERHGRGVRLTAAGQTLVAHADGIIARVQAAEDALGAIAGLRGGHLRLATFPSAGAALIPQAIARFGAEHPLVGLSLVEGEPEELVPRLRAGELDLAVLFEFGERQNFAAAQRSELFDDPLDVALPCGHPLAARDAVELRLLCDEAWVQTRRLSPCAQQVVRSCHAAGFEPRVAFESDDYATVQGLVAAGTGVALIPRLALASGVHPGVAVRPLSPDPVARRVFALTPEASRLIPAAPAMVAVLEALSASGRPAGVPDAPSRVSAAGLRPAAETVSG